jgi:hypothetical protein
MGDEAGNIAGNLEGIDDIHPAIAVRIGTIQVKVGRIKAGSILGDQEGIDDINSGIAVDIPQPGLCKKGQGKKTTKTDNEADKKQWFGYAAYIHFVHDFNPFLLIIIAD